MMGRPLTVGGKQVPIATFGWPSFIGTTCSSIPFVRADRQLPPNAEYAGSRENFLKQSAAQTLPHQCHSVTRYSAGSRWD
jgi:hypothetical protein